MGRPVSADRPRLPGSRGCRAAEGTARRTLPAARAGPGLGLRLLTAGPGEAGAPRARRRGVALPSPDASDSRLQSQKRSFDSATVSSLFRVTLTLSGYWVDPRKNRRRRLGFNFSSQFLESFTSHLDKNSRAKSPVRFPLLPAPPLEVWFSVFSKDLT